MMKAAVEAAGEEAGRLGIDRPRIIAVTVLTSIGQRELNQQLGIKGQIQDLVTYWSQLAQKSGMDGVVASAREAAAIRNACGEAFIIVTPGIRPAGTAAGDQKRIVTPSDAIKAGATYIVVGRPVTAAADPLSAARQIVYEMQE